MRVLNAEIGEVTGLAFSPDGRALAAAVEDQGVFLWNLDTTDAPLQLDPSARRKTQSLYFTPDSRAVGWAGSTGWKVFDRSRKRIAQLSLEAGGNLTWITQTPDGSRRRFRPQLPGIVAHRLEVDRRWRLGTGMVRVQGGPRLPQHDRVPDGPPRRHAGPQAPPARTAGPHRSACNSAPASPAASKPRAPIRTATIRGNCSSRRAANGSSASTT